MMPNMNQAMLQPLLASDTVRFVGEPVAVVVTEEPYQGEDAIELVDIDYDFLPAVVDMNDALTGDDGLLFPEAGTNVVCKFGDAAALDPDLFDGCEVVASEVIQNQRVAPAPMESRAAAAAVWGEDGRLTAWIPNQGAQGTKGALAGRARAQARTRCGSSRPTWAARSARSSAPTPSTRSPAGSPRSSAGPGGGRRRAWRTCSAMTHGRAQQHKVTIGGMRDGTVLAYRLEILQDCGAYPKVGAFLPSLTDPDDARPVPHPAGRGLGRPRWSPTPRRSARTAARGGPRRPPRSTGRSTCSPPPPGSTRPRCAARTCCRSSPSRTRPRSARSTTRATT